MGDVIDFLKTKKRKMSAVSMLDNNLKNLCSFRMSLPANGWLQVKMCFPGTDHLGKVTFWTFYCRTMYVEVSSKYVDIL